MTNGKRETGPNPFTRHLEPHRSFEDAIDTLSAPRPVPTRCISFNRLAGLGYDKGQYRMHRQQNTEAGTHGADGS